MLQTKTQLIVLFKNLFSAETAPMTTLDENVNRVPQQQHKTTENMGELLFLVATIFPFFTFVNRAADHF